MSQPLDGTTNTIYSDPVITSQPTSPHSNGSFGQVFIVLAVIVVISGCACVFGRVFKRRFRRGHDNETKTEQPKKGGGDQGKKNKGVNGLGPNEWQKPNFSMRDGDIEFGFEKKNPSSKGSHNSKAKNGGSKSKPKGNKLHSSNNGGQKPEVRFAENV